MNARNRLFVRGTFVGGFAALACFMMILRANAQSLSPAEAQQIAEDA